MRLPDNIRDEIVDLLMSGGDIPREYQHTLFPPERREYELVYAGKERKADILAATMAVPLQPVRTFGPQPAEDEWRNHLIFGDNIQAMKTLHSMKKQGLLLNPDGSEGVKLVYIDPPFATKKEFTGNANQDQRAYEDKIDGARFVEFIRQRLVMIREVLADEGSVFVHMDQRKIHYIKVVMDELFGENNFRNEIMLPGRASKNLQQQFESITRLNVRHDTLLWYTKTAKAKFGKLWVEKHNVGNPEGHWHHFWSTADRPTMRYELFGHTPEKGQWVWGKETAMQAVENYERFLEEGGGRTLAEYWRDTGASLRFVRRNPEDGTPSYWRAPAKDRLADTVWAGVPVYAASTKYPTEKNEALLAQVIELASDEGDIVLDAFAGSGTTPAVAEKLGRKWIAIDSGKFSIYTIQKRLLNLKDQIGNKGKRLDAKPFTLYNAGLYDFKSLKSLPWEDWRFFALQLFECKDEAHFINGFKLDGRRRGASVHVFNHKVNPDVKLDEEYIENIHQIIGGKVGAEFCVIAPKAVFDFQQDYIDLGGVRYYALRIPYSYISELHNNRLFSKLRQPNDEMDVNNTVDSFGFDFIVRPTLKYETGLMSQDQKLFREGFIRLTEFESRVKIRGENKRGGMESLSMLMIDFDYNGEVFDFDRVIYGDELAKNDWAVRFPEEQIGEKIMAVFIDTFGNEAQEIIARDQFGPVGEFVGVDSAKGE